MEYFFDFGDGTNSSWIDDGNTSHIYAKPGKYTLKFKVRDSKGVESDWSVGVEVEVRRKTIVTDEAIPYLWFALALIIAIVLAVAGYALWKKRVHCICMHRQKKSKSNMWCRICEMFMVQLRDERVAKCDGCDNLYHKECIKSMKKCVNCKTVLWKKDEKKEEITNIDEMLAKLRK